MRRNLVYIVLIALVLSALTGCAPKQPAAQGSAGPQIAEPGEAISQTGDKAEGAADAANTAIDQTQQQLENDGADAP